MQPAHALLDANPRQPAGRPVEFSDVADIPALIADPPSPKAEAWAAAVQRRDTVDQFEQAQRVFRAAADVEGLAGDVGQALLGRQERIREIIDEWGGADLPDVAVR